MNTQASNPEFINKAVSLPEATLAVVQDKGTERPFCGIYDDYWRHGSYLCRLCGLALFRSKTKFHSGCGWPSFDEELPNSITRKPDKDGQRTEIVCARCQAHLGHVFMGEGFSPKNTRHCVNSASLDFVADMEVLDTEEAIFAAGCFWGVEYLFKQLKGVLKTEVGYAGGHKKDPSYEEVCQGNTGHYEAIRVVYDPTRIQYEDIAKYFFEIHDFSQTTGQGPDLGPQYLSMAFYYNDKQKHILETLIKTLQEKGYSVATKILPVTTFWPAEKYHQDYYKKTGKLPYCHVYQKKFGEKSV